MVRVRYRCCFCWFQRSSQWSLITGSAVHDESGSDDSRGREGFKAPAPKEGSEGALAPRFKRPYEGSLAPRFPRTAKRPYTPHNQKPSRERCSLDDSSPRANIAVIGDPRPPSDDRSRQAPRSDNQRTADAASLQLADRATQKPTSTSLQRVRIVVLDNDRSRRPAPSACDDRKAIG